eukprot:107862-Amphidinium_carterae.1
MSPTHLAGRRTSGPVVLSSRAVLLLDSPAEPGLPDCQHWQSLANGKFSSLQKTVTMSSFRALATRHICSQKMAFQPKGGG